MTHAGAGPGPLFAPWEARRPHARRELVEIARAGFRGLHVASPAHLGPEDALQTARFIALLRDANGLGLRVCWNGAVSATLRPAIAHLDPPRDDESGPAWPQRAVPGLLARYGPTFVVVHDRRDATPIRTTISDACCVAALVRYWEPGGFDETLAQAIERLREERLILAVGDLLLTLPSRFTSVRA